MGRSRRVERPHQAFLDLVLMVPILILIVQPSRRALLPRPRWRDDLASVSDRQLLDSFLASPLAHFVGRGPRLSGLVSGQRSSHPSDLHVVGLLTGADLAIGVFLGEVIQLIDGGFVVGNERGFTDEVVDPGKHPVGQEPRR